MALSVEHDPGGPLLYELCNVRPQRTERVWFLAVLGINRVSILAILVLIGYGLNFHHLYQNFSLSRA